MEEIDSFTERNVKQPTLRSCINTNDSKGNNVPLLDNTTLASGDATNVDQYNSSYNKLNTEISKNGNAEEKNVEENYTSPTMSSRSDSSSMSEQNALELEHQQSSEIEQAISVAAMLQHGVDESFEENIQPYSESNEEGYDSDAEEEQIDDSKLLEFMLQNSQSQEEFHNQYDQLTSSLQDDSSEKFTSETGLSETNVPTVLENLASNNAMNELDSQNEKQCWICYAKEEDDTSAVWTSPCRCRGTTKWVHQACIQRWVDEKQKGNNMAAVECPQCGTKYVIHLPCGSYFVALLDKGELLIQRISPIIAGGVCVGSLYWTCVTFGAVTLMQTMGQHRCLIVMERADPLFLLVSLPLIPVVLVLGKMVRWEEPVLKSLRKYVPLIPLSKYILPAFNYTPERQSLQASLPPISDPVSVTRTFCGALFFPTIAAFLGSALYEHVPSQLKRTILGGFTFVAIKGVLKIYHKQHNYIRQCKRQILDFKEDR